MKLLTLLAAASQPRSEPAISLAWLTTGIKREHQSSLLLRPQVQGNRPSMAMALADCRQLATIGMWDGTNQVKVTGGEAAPYEVFVGNTHPDTTETIVKEVLAQVSQSMPEEMKLQEPLMILEVECLTKPRTDGRKSWTKNWRVQVSNRFREHMLRPEAYPMGWSSRRYFPARAARPAVPPLNPVQDQPDPKRPNLGQSQDGTSSTEQ